MEENDELIEINENYEGIDGVAHHNSNRPCFLSEDGRYYCYEVWDPERKKNVIQRHEIGTDGFTEEWTIFLDETDHEHDLNDRYQRELQDELFQRKLQSMENAVEEDIDSTINPWNDERISCASPEEILLGEPKKEDPQVAKVREVVETQFTDAQKDFYYDHFGMGRQLEEMRREEAEMTGKLVTNGAMTSRKNKMLDKVAKALGTKREKRHKYPKK